MESLTPREVEVLRLLSQGQTNPQIAQNLLVSRGTVKIHVQHIISKLGVSRALGLPQCATPPEEVYELAKRRALVAPAVSGRRAA